ncbi:signal peptide peptidase SppA [Novosphingobium sp. FKTRR1]|uniref:signal peptide peptidase SppA n=1 Tax=unclassified Novosphingobium TaxID=2644732 RepID=UPI001CF013A2|nr:signal peptide peptidase SppA [Novosphingobium sp. FKTRR1]
MKFARSVWKILVAIKDGLVLAFLLLFFFALFAALSMRPAPGGVKDGALAITLDGPLVEERTQFDPTSLLMSGAAPQKEYLAREVVRAIETAATDSRIKAITIDLEKFPGGRQVTLERVGAAIDKAKAAGKPVLVRSVLYQDGALLLAAHASEAWIDPVGGAMLSGPGGTQIYYKALLDRLQVKAHVFKVGTYKSAVEPYIRENSSPEAKQATTAVLAAVWQNWQDNVHKARPKADLAKVIGDPVGWLQASGGDAAKAAVQAGLLDRIGDKVAFGKRVAELVGADADGPDGAFKATRLSAYLADKRPSTSGKAIAVVTVAGDIVDGEAGPGSAGGTRIADLIDKAAAKKDYAALVVRVDSPGGSVLAAERIRAAIERIKAKKLPVIVSMGTLAASGGYWVSTPAERIFAEPATITGSIGIFAIIPTFESTLAKAGIGTDPLRITPLSGQPDVIGGLTPQMEAMIQSEIEQGYGRFVGLVAQSRHMTPQAVDKIAQGRIWDGGTARQIGLVDEFGGLDEALAYAAKRAGATTWHPVFLGQDEDSFSGFLTALLGGDDADGDAASASASADLAGRVAQMQGSLVAQVSAGLDRLMGQGGMQAYCLECGGMQGMDAGAQGAAGASSRHNAGWLATVATLLHLR